jgi:hypothetical protein
VTTQKKIALIAVPLAVIIYATMTSLRHPVDGPEKGKNREARSEPGKPQATGNKPADKPAEKPEDVPATGESTPPDIGSLFRGFSSTLTEGELEKLAASIVAEAGAKNIPLGGRRFLCGGPLRGE